MNNFPATRPTVLDEQSRQTKTSAVVKAHSDLMPATIAKIATALGLTFELRQEE